MDKVFLIGHRGVGKTSLLKAFKKNNSQYQVYDLDQEVTWQFKKPIAEYFQNSEEGLFREREIETLRKICQERGPLVVALGAGFMFDQFQFPSDSLVLWVRRETDSLGRIFLDTERPSLTDQTDPIEEWEQKFVQRELMYTKTAHAQMIIPERVEYNKDILGQYLFERTVVPENFYCTLLPKENIEACLRGSFGIELRNDIWSELDIHKILKQVSFQRKIILAVRQLNPLTIDFLKNLERYKYPNLKIDWDIVLAQQNPNPPNLRPGDIISEHRNDIQELMSWKQNYHNVFVYKFAPEVKSLDEALELYTILKKEFPFSAFLPRSGDLDLSWLRMVLAKDNEINFFRFSEGSAREQPLWYDLNGNVAKAFYGILGEKVTHSLTPDMHRDFFGDKAVHPVRISVPASHIKDGFLNQLRDLGVRYLAVTSPYKNLIYQDIDVKDSSAQTFQSVNTVYLGKNLKQFTNTDHLGLKLFFEQHLDPQLPTVVFGGGSLLKMLRDILPDAFFLAARTNTLRESEAESESGASATLQHEADFHHLTQAQVIWAAGEKGLWPQWSFTVKKVLDLDYRSNSRAKRWVYATHKQTGQAIPYVSGLDFFKHQGLEQQKFWSQYDI